MRNFLKYSRLRLREVEVPVTPVGPDFESARRKQIMIAGTQLSLQLPRHDGGGRKHETLNPRGDHVKKGYTNRYLSNYIKNQGWQCWLILGRTWAFYGSWFTGCLSNIRFNITAYRWKYQPDNTSVFHPKIFELAVAHLLNSSYGYRASEESPTHKAPVNWQVVNTLPVPAARFRVEAEPGHSPSVRQVLLFPVSDNVIVNIQAIFSQNCSRLIGKLGKEISDKEMQSLLDKVFASVQLEFDDAGKQSLAKSLKVSGDTTLSEGFAPLKWPIYVDKYGKESEEIKKKIIEERGCY
ncbi:hypothetical protein ACJJIF_13190 [Microbulbifer sp. SSSA002]|uniref:hypothetical protein n=1 Tax=Microbulbifer sp. SSSA002 TaxID=3243376 RepID=UPI004039A814